MTQTNQELIEKWTMEFMEGGIPSSVRSTPSGAVVWAVEQLRRQNYPLRKAVDIGCGKGRNSIYLARQGMDVTAMDFTPNAITHLNDTAMAQGLSDKIRALVYDVTEPWPIAPRSMDLAVDAFCFKHITPDEARRGYKESLIRCLRGRGHYMISFASIGDGYYGRYVVKRVNEHEQIVVDPVNGIESALFSPECIKKFFAPELDLFMEFKHNKPSTMHGKTYQRETYALLFRWNPKIYSGN